MWRLGLLRNVSQTKSSEHLLDSLGVGVILGCVNIRTIGTDFPWSSYSFIPFREREETGSDKRISIEDQFASSDCRDVASFAERRHNTNVFRLLKLGFTRHTYLLLHLPFQYHQPRRHWEGSQTEDWTNRTLCLHASLDLTLKYLPLWRRGEDGSKLIRPFACLKYRMGLSF